MTLLSDVVARTRRHLYTETRDQLNRLTTTVDTDDTTLTFDFALNTIQEGAVIAMDAEEMYVWAVADNTATVQRGYGGSTAATHTAGAIAYVNPKFSGFSIIQACNEELLSLSAPGNLFRVRTVEITAVGGTDTYDLTSVTDMIDVLTVYYDAADSTGTWPEVPRGGWRITRDLDAGDFPSAKSITMLSYVRGGFPVRIAYKAPYTAALATMADNVESVTGLQATAHDILSMGAAVRLTVGSEIARNFLDQGETRRADEVQAGARQNSMQMLRQTRRERIAEEAARLYAMYPGRS